MWKKTFTLTNKTKKRNRMLANESESVTYNIQKMASIESVPDQKLQRCVHRVSPQLKM